jgi:cyclic pyranopterin phosphate synthase
VSKLTHLDDQGRARMVDVSDKPATAREAVAGGFVRMSPATLKLALSGQGKKGDVRVDPADDGFSVTAKVRTTGQTGVEMEALTAVSVACLTIYDMLKAAEKGMVIEAIGLISKSGGASGDWRIA